LDMGLLYSYISMGGIYSKTGCIMCFD